MPTRDIQDYLDSGEASDMKVGGTDPDQSVLTGDGSKAATEIQLTPLSATPTHTEGRIFYDSRTKSLTVSTDNPDYELPLGQNIVVPVINRTAVTIPIGSAVRHDGVDAITDRPKVILAQAIGYTEARTLGFATHDISPGEPGWLTQVGVVGPMDTSTLPTNTPLYLSATVPGWYGPEQPDYLTQVGGVLVQDALNGYIHIERVNNMNLPFIGAYFEDIPGTVNFNTATPTRFTGWTISTAVGVDVTSGDSFVLPTSGLYSGTFTISGAGFSSNTNGHLILIEVVNVTTGVRFPYNFLVPRNNTDASDSFSALMPVNAGDELTMEYSSQDSPGAAVTLTGVQMSIESRHLR